MAGDRRRGVGHGAHLHRDLLDLHTSARARRQLAQRARDDLLVGIEARVDRADRHQRGQHRRTRAGGHEVAGRDLQLADAARHRCAYLRVAEAQLRGLQLSLGGAQVGVGLALRVEAVVVLALRDGVVLQQLLGALVVAPGVDQARLRGEDLRVGTVDVGLVRRRVDRQQQVACFDQRALAEMHGLHGASDARPDVDAFDGFQAAREVVPGRHVALYDGGDRHGRRLDCLRWLGGSLAAVQGYRRGHDRDDGGERGASHPESVAAAGNRVSHGKAPGCRDEEMNGGGTRRRGRACGP